jgi:hypothetical protein
MMNVMARASSLSLCILALVLGACDGPSPDDVCAGAARAIPSLDTFACVADLKDEKVHDPQTYEIDVKCLTGLRPGNAITVCLDNPRSLDRLYREQGRGEADLSPQTAAIDQKMAELRAAISKLPDGHKNAFDSLLGTAAQQQSALKQQLDPKGQGQGSTAPSASPPK